METDFRAKYMNLFDTYEEDEYEYAVTGLIRYFRLVLARKIFRSTRIYTKYPRDAALPLPIHPTSFKAFGGNYAVRDHFLQDQRYWNCRFTFQDRLQNLPVIDYDINTGWSSIPPQLQQIADMAREIYAMTEHKLQGLVRIFHEIEDNDFFRADDSIDPGGFTDDESPE